MSSIKILPRPLSPAFKQIIQEMEQALDLHPRDGNSVSYHEEATSYHVSVLCLHKLEEGALFQARIVLQHAWPLIAKDERDARTTPQGTGMQTASLYLSKFDVGSMTDQQISQMLNGIQPYGHGRRKDAHRQFGGKDTYEDFDKFAEELGMSLRNFFCTGQPPELKEFDSWDHGIVDPAILQQQQSFGQPIGYPTFGYPYARNPGMPGGVMPASRGGW